MGFSKFLIIILALIACSITGIGGIVPSAPLITLDPLKSRLHSELSIYESQKLNDHIENRLPNYVKHFKIYSVKYNIPWTLIAAVAYQESKWNEDAISYTGVKGLMQLTAQTAEHLGITDREDPHQSIQGGAYYLKYLYDKTSKNQSQIDRWAMALAAYNLGWGHIRDAQKLAVKLNKNPNKWKDLKVVLPKLELPHYYLTLNFGYARGNEALDFVESVIKYYSILNTTLYPKKQLAQNNK